MLKGSKPAIVRKIQPISIHGQLSYDVHYTFDDEPDGQARVARVGPEALGPGLQVGDKVIAIGKNECEEMLHDQLIGGETVRG